jgi:hypothetical protein
MRSNCTPSAVPRDLIEQRLGQTRHALEQHVTVGEECHEHALDHRILANYGLANFIADSLGPSGTGEHDAGRYVVWKKSDAERSDLRVRFDSRVVRRFPSKQKERPMGLPPQIYTRLPRSGGGPEAVEERFIRGSGPGGQNINKTSTTVCLRHAATGIEVRCQRERSQAANREWAWEESVPPLGGSAAASGGGGCRRPRGRTTSDAPKKPPAKGPHGAGQTSPRTDQIRPRARGVGLGRGRCAGWDRFLIASALGCSHGTGERTPRSPRRETRLT